MEQLQETLKQRVEAGNSYSVINDFYNFECFEDYIWNKDGDTISYHELFSKDSGLMEFMKWDNVYVDNDLKLDNDYIQGTDTQYHYMIMGPMSATDKINYFNTNAYLHNELP